MSSSKTAKEAKETLGRVQAEEASSEARMAVAKVAEFHSPQTAAPKAPSDADSATAKIVRKRAESRQFVELDDSDIQDSDVEFEGAVNGEAPFFDVKQIEEVGQYLQRREFSKELGTTSVEPDRMLHEDIIASHAGEVLAERSGWIEKLGKGWFGQRQRRWFVLKARKLMWYKSPQDTVCRGTLDFDLVMIEVERLWLRRDSKQSRGSKQHQSEEDPSSGLLDASGAAAGGLTSSRWWPFSGETQEPRFRICPVGSNRAFELRALDMVEGEAWIEVLVEHIRGSLPRKLGRIVPPPTARAWWRVDRISASQFDELADTGDVLFFKTTGTIPKIIRGWTRGRYDHCALMVRLSSNSLAVLEATGNYGVGLCSWKQFIENRWYLLYPEMAVRRVQFPREKQRLLALQNWLLQVIGKPYKLTMEKMKAQSFCIAQEDKDKTFFCSELVAEALKVLGVIPRGG